MYLDTHTVVFLYGGETGKLSPAARKAIEDHDLLVSPMVVLELEYLHEIGRLAATATEIIDDVAQSIGLAVCDLPFPAIVRQALSEKWSRDPFDRVIVAHAKLRKHYRLAIW